MATRGAPASATAEQQRTASSPNYPDVSAIANQSVPGWIDLYLWLEIYSGIALLLIAMINGFGAIDYMCGLQIPIWFAPQMLVPHFTVSTVFFLGRGPHHPGQLIAVRSQVYTGLSLALSIIGIAVSGVFVGLKIAYFYSSKASADLKSNGGIFVLLMCSILLLIVIYGVNIYTIGYSWYRRRAVLDDPRNYPAAKRT